MTVLNNAVTVIYCDAAVQKVERFENVSDLKLTRYGGGGTDFKPPFEYIDKENLDVEMLLYFTDGWCSSFPDEKLINFPLYWCLTEATSYFKPPFGDTILIRD